MTFLTVFLFLAALWSFLFCSNPLYMCLSLVMISISVAMIFMLLSFKWLALAVVLVFLGGMMVMFFYVTALSNNDKIMKSKLSSLPMITILILVTGWNYSNSVSTCKSVSMDLANIYSVSSFGMIYLLMFYLLVGLFLIVKLCFNFEGSLVKSF